MRVTNAVENSRITYEDSLVVSGSWAPLSTDAGQDVCLTTRNVLAGIGWLEVAQDGKEYTATKEVNGVTYGFSLGDSANYNSGYVSYCDSGFHNYYYDSQFFGTVDMTGGSLYAGQCLFMMKCYSDTDTDGCYTNLIVDGTDLNGEEVGVTAAEMESFEAENPDAVPVMVDYEPEETSYAVFRDLSVDGDIYNAVWQAEQ